MSRRPVEPALAEVTATLVDAYDVVTALTELATVCRDVVGADGVGVMVLGPARPSASGAHADAPELELLAATSHRAAELELYQDQVTEGPCRDAVMQDVPVSASGPEDLRRRWPQYGPFATARGVRTIWAVPMRWRGRAFGGLNVFRSDDESLDASTTALTRTFADLATVLIVHAGSLPDADGLGADIGRALEGRIVIEQAKGVLMALRDLDAGAAFEALQADARRHGRPLSEEAAQVVDAASRGHSRPQPS